MAGKTGMKRYSVEFRTMVINEWMNNGTPMKQLVLKYDLSTVRIIKKWLAWYREYGKPEPPASGKKRGRIRTKDETLEQRVSRLEMENDLLKKFHELLREERKRK
jgi:transposase-like protein